MSPRGPDESDFPPGPALDSSGRIVGRPEDPEASRPHEEPSEELPPGPSLDPSGRIVPGPGGGGRSDGETPRAPASLDLEPLAGSLGDAADARRFHRSVSAEAPLELEPRPRKADPAPVHFGASMRPRTFGWLLGCLGTLVLLGAVLLVGTWFVGRTVAAPGALIVESQPSGAEVIIAGVRAGRTPFATDNHYRIDAVPIELRHRGYLTWHGTFRGRVNQKLKVRLLRAPTPPPVPAERSH